VSGRRAARRTALFLLYQWDVTGQPLASLYEGEVDDFARQTAEAVAARAGELDARITAASEDWTADRLGAIERNILRIALYELDGDDVPDEVAIDEAVTLAKRYATDDAARLVNGILGRIVRERVTCAPRNRWLARRSCSLGWRRHAPSSSSCPRRTTPSGRSTS
jgi:N utilization substance protein B